MYLENKAEIPKSLTSFWKQRCNKVLGKMWEEQCCWLAIIQQKFTEKAEKSMFPVMVISRYLNHLIRQGMVYGLKNVRNLGKCMSTLTRPIKVIRAIVMPKSNEQLCSELISVRQSCNQFCL